MNKILDKARPVVTILSNIMGLVLMISVAAMLLFIFTQTHYYELISLYQATLYLLAIQLVVDGIFIVLNIFNESDSDVKES